MNTTGARIQTDVVSDHHQRIAIKERMAALGNALRSETVEQFRETVKKDRATWAQVVKTSGASVD